RLVWGVNVFHLARDLDAVLAEARAALVPGGWLVIGEALRPRRGEPVGAELPFQLLATFTDVILDPATRATPGFLTAEEWLGARAGHAPRARTAPPRAAAGQAPLGGRPEHPEGPGLCPPGRAPGGRARRRGRGAGRERGRHPREGPARRAEGCEQERVLPQQE